MGGALRIPFITSSASSLSSFRGGVTTSLTESCIRFALTSSTFFGGLFVIAHKSESSKDPAIAQQHKLATPKKCKDAKELKERLTAWSLKVAENAHQFKTIDEAQKMFVVREMMPNDIRREFLTGPRKFNEIVRNWRSL